jgi:hypothetical protein
VGIRSSRALARGTLIGVLLDAGAQLRGDGTGLGPDRLFALAELSFLYAEQGNRQDYYLAAAVYAAPGVTTHSIIAVLGEGPVTGRTDGVVAYESAHLDGVESEKIVRSSHSCQGEPDTILEVRRILREYVAAR